MDNIIYSFGLMTMLDLILDVCFGINGIARLKGIMKNSEEDFSSSTAY